MKKVYFLIMFLGFASIQHAQTITGRLVDQDGNGLRDLPVELYFNSKYDIAISEAGGTFVFNNLTDVKKDDELPTGYSVSDNYPNPFNPKTRITLTLPNNGNVRISLYDVVGQRVLSDIEKFYGAGTNFVDLELNGLPNGIYFARLTLDEKYTVTKKLMLLYGSQHLSSVTNLANSSLTKPTAINNLTTPINLDSLVVASSITGRITFKDLPPVVDSSLNLGNLIIERFCAGLPTVTYEGKTYHTVQIGTQCWLRENLDVGVYVASTNTGSSHSDVSDNGIIEKYCYENNEANCATYGGLYDWDEAMAYSTTPGTKGICPTGWHIPTKAEFETLMATIGNDGNKLKREDQGTGSGLGTNTSGFSALLSGGRNYNGNFGSLGDGTYFWSSTEYNASTAYYVVLWYEFSPISMGHDFLKYGFSIRCLKD